MEMIILLLVLGSCFINFNTDEVCHKKGYEIISDQHLI